MYNVSFLEPGDCDNCNQNLKNIMDLLSMIKGG